MPARGSSRGVVRLARARRRQAHERYRYFDRTRPPGPGRPFRICWDHATPRGFVPGPCRRRQSKQFEAARPIECRARRALCFLTALGSPPTSPSPRKRGPRTGSSSVVDKRPCVYILANRRNGTLYTGVTSELFRRVSQHRLDVVTVLRGITASTDLSLRRISRNDGRCNSAGEADQEMATSLEAGIDRATQSAMAGSLR